eukprot:6455186-Amphidinium_carterae.1
MQRARTGWCVADICLPGLKERLLESGCNLSSQIAELPLVPTVRVQSLPYCRSSEHESKDGRQRRAWKLCSSRPYGNHLLRKTANTLTTTTLLPVRLEFELYRSQFRSDSAFT